MNEEIPVEVPTTSEPPTTSEVPTTSEPLNTGGGGTTVVNVDMSETNALLQQNNEHLQLISDNVISGNYLVTILIVVLLIKLILGRSKL